MELLETILHGITGSALAHEIKTMMLAMIAVAHSSTKVAGGTVLATVQTSMVSTMVDHTHPTLMV